MKYINNETMKRGFSYWQERGKETDLNVHLLRLQDKPKLACGCCDFRLKAIIEVFVYPESLLWNHFSFCVMILLSIINLIIIIIIIIVQLLSLCVYFSILHTKNNMEVVVVYSYIFPLYYYIFPIIYFLVTPLLSVVCSIIFF